MVVSRVYIKQNLNFCFVIGYDLAGFCQVIVQEPFFKVVWAL